MAIRFLMSTWIVSGPSSCTAKATPDTVCGQLAYLDKE